MRRSLLVGALLLAFLPDPIAIGLGMRHPAHAASFRIPSAAEHARSCGSELMGHDPGLSFVNAPLEITNAALGGGYHDQESAEDKLSDRYPVWPIFWGWWSVCAGMIVISPQFWEWGERLRDRHDERGAKRYGRIGLGLMYGGLAFLGIGVLAMLCGLVSL